MLSIWAGLIMSFGNEKRDFSVIDGKKNRKMQFSFKYFILNKEIVTRHKHNNFKHLPL